jgi:hypothetical protein
VSEPPLPRPVVDAALEAWAGAGRTSRVPVQGTSMAPLLRPGDVAFVAHGRARLWPGDLLAYRAGDRVVVHRLLRRRGASLRLAGDNRPEADAPVPPGAVLGRVVAFERGGVVRGLRSPLARALGWTVAAAFPLRRRRLLRRLPRALAALAARCHAMA